MTETLKSRISAGKVTIGGWLTVSSPEVAEALAYSGLDWLVADMEHSSLNVGAVTNACIAAKRSGCPVLVRLPSADPYLARRVLDVGAEGVLVPVVEDPDELEEFISHLFYPPRGKRGVSLGRFNDWGGSFEDYMENFSPVIMPQIETMKGVEAATAIAALDGVDGLFLGPYDLSADLGKPGDFTTPEFIAASDKVKDACAKTGKTLGGHQVAPEPFLLETKISEGFSFIAYGTDMIAMRAALSGVTKIER